MRPQLYRAVKRNGRTVLLAEAMPHEEVPVTTRERLYMMCGVDPTEASVPSVSIEQADGEWRGFISGSHVRTFGASELDARRWLAGNGVCPECGGAVTIDDETTMSLPPHRVPEDLRTVRAAMCSGCEFAMEL